jgi:hypothetical protein
MSLINNLLVTLLNSSPLYCEQVVKKISKLTRPEDGSLRAALFLEKPDRKIYPDYYMLVPRPTSFKVLHMSPSNLIFQHCFYQ